MTFCLRLLGQSHCKNRFPAVCMDFDHRPGEVKLDEVSDMVSGWKAWGLVEAEISKCDLVCSNCHRIRTWKRNRGSEN
jgi:hypothetical protein